MSTMTLTRWLPRAAWALVLSLALWPGPAPAQRAPAPVETNREAPEAESGFTPRKAAIATKHMAAAANPLAAEAGRDILRQGGSAIDAAIAMQMVLTLVEPQSSGIGGGGFLVHYDASRKQIVTYDGRETAPAAATADMFLDAKGEPPPFIDVVSGGQAVATPGLLRMLEMAHRDYGRLPWGRLFEPAMRLAETGWLVTPRLHQLIAAVPRLKEMPAAAAYFYKDGQPRQVGDRIENPELFETFRLIANGGANAFYRGPIARDIIAAVTDPAAQGANGKAGRLEMADLTLYRAVKREPVCGPYRGLRVCGMGPPSSGGIGVVQILGILDHFKLRDLSPGSLEAVHLISEASRLAYADRSRYVADSDMTPVPVRALVSPHYLAKRAEGISLTHALPRAEPGQVGDRASFRAVAPDETTESPATSHMSAVDAAGNAVSLTSSIENAFGSGVFVRGFLLNNHMTDFSLRPSRGEARAINRIEPGKRPRSSMAPIIVTDRQGHLLLTMGSPGGARIIPYVVQSIVGVIDWNLDVQRAVSLPHHVNMNGATELERGTDLVQLATDLQRLGHQVEITSQTSGLHAIAVMRRGTKTTLIGGADPRREGQALGD